MLANKFNATPIKTFRLALLAGLGLVALLGGLTSLNLLVGVFCCVIMLLIALVEPRPELIVYGLTLALPLTGGLARGAVVPILRVGQLLVVVGFILFVLARPSRLGKARLTVIDLIFALFVLSEAVFPVLALYYRGEYINNTPSIEGSTPLQLLLGPIQYYLLYRIMVATISSERQIKVLVKLSFVASIIVSIIGILQKLGVGPVKTFIETYYPPVQLGYTVADVDQRITSTLAHFSGLGAYLTFTIILALACYSAHDRLKFSPLLLGVTILLDSVALVLTGTLAAWIGLAVGAVVVFTLTRNLPKLVLFVPIGIILAVVIFKPFISSRLDEQIGSGAAQGLLPLSLVFRIQLWNDLFLPAIGEHLIFGAGPAPTVFSKWSAEESQYLLLLLRGGLFYFFSYILLIGVCIAACWRQIKRKSGDASQSVAIATLAILVAMSVMNFSAEYFTYVGGTQTLWTLIAIVVASTQFQMMGTPAAIKQSVGGKERAVSLPFQNSLGSAATAHGLVAESHLTGPKHLVASSSLVPNSIGLEAKNPLRYLQHNIGLKRLLDWRFVKDSLVVGVSSIVARGLGLLFATLLAHSLSPDDFGFFRYSVTIATIITIASSSSPISISRFLAAHPDDQQARDRYFSNGLVGLALLLFVSLFISVPIMWLLHVLNFGTATCVVCLAIYYGYLYVVRGLNSAWKMGLTYSLSNVALIIALLVVLDLFGLHTPTAALMIYGLTNLVPIFLLELVKPMALHFRPGLISRAILLELARFALPIVISSGSLTIWNGIDIVLIENIAPHLAGNYAVASTLAQAFIFIPAAITWVLLPRVAALERAKSRRYSLGAILVSFLISLVGLVIVGIWGHKLIDLTFGQRYDDAYLPLLILSVGMSIYSLYIVLEGFIIGSGRPNLSAQAMVMAIIGTGATGFWLISWLGPVGASLSFTVGAVLGFAALLFNTWRFLHGGKQKESNTLSSPVPTADITI